MLEPILIVELALIGICTGFLAGVLGIGGGMLMGPFLTLILSHRGVSADLAVKMAIATSMATIIFTSVSSVRAHHKKKAVRWDLVKGLAPGIVIGSLIGSMGIFAFAKGTYLALFFAVFVGFSATQMFLDKKPAPSRQVPGFQGLLGAGGLIGLLSGLVGAGGGFISVPFMAWCNVAIHNAVATSAALGFPIALANVAGYVVSGQGVQNLPDYSFGYLWLPALAVIVGTVPPAYMVALATDTSAVRRCTSMPLSRSFCTSESARPCPSRASITARSGPLACIVIAFARAVA